MADNLLVVGEPTGGTRRRSVLQHFGPASYTQMTTGPVAGGDILKASAFGLTTLETVKCDAAQDGVHAVAAVTISAEPSQVTLAWFTTLARSAQVGGATNLSAVSVMIEATGL